MPFCCKCNSRLGGSSLFWDNGPYWAIYEFNKETRYYCEKCVKKELNVLK